MIDKSKGKVELNNYSFSGLEASQVGAIKSVLDYYNVPATPSWIYGMSGMAFLIVHDQTFKKPNAGPPESELYRLVRNIGLNIEGVHTLKKRLVEKYPYEQSQEQMDDMERTQIVVVLNELMHLEEIAINLIK